MNFLQVLALIMIALFILNAGETFVLVLRNKYPRTVPRWQDYTTVLFSCVSAALLLVLAF